MISENAFRRSGIMVLFIIWLWIVLVVYLSNNMWPWQESTRRTWFCIMGSFLPLVVVYGRSLGVSVHKKKKDKGE